VREALRWQPAVLCGLLAALCPWRDWFLVKLDQ
jgi:hypothetical protein